MKCTIPVESKTQTYQRRVGSGIPAERPGRVAQGWVATKLFVWETKILRIFKSIEKESLQHISREGTSELLCKPTEELNQPTTTSLSWFIISGHALHEKGIQRQVGVGTLVNSQQRKALAVPLINRWSTGHFVPPPVYIGFPLFVLAKRRSGHIFTLRWRARGAVGFQGRRNVGTLFCPASPRPTARPAPCRPDPPVVCPGFGFDRSPGR